MIRSINAKEAKGALAEFYLNTYGISISRKSGLTVGHIDSAGIHYKNAIGEAKYLPVKVRTEYLFGDEVADGSQSTLPMEDTNKSL